MQCTGRNCGFRFFDLSNWSSEYAQSDYYENIPLLDPVATKPWIQTRVELIKRFRDTGTVAELGCGFGETALALVNDGFDVTAVDDSVKVIDYLKEKYPNVRWRCEAIVPFLESQPKSFDIISMFHVLEHLPNPKQVIEAISSSLRTDGLFVIEVPDVGGGMARLMNLRWAYYLMHHVNYFSFKSLTALLTPFGFKNIFKQRTYHFAHPEGKIVKDAIKGAIAFAGFNLGSGPIKYLADQMIGRFTGGARRRRDG
jgi:2-polyprenyl-3-methyl-5-hydroxy-6-metoxy-1,4-benzoquinol methylase